MLSIDTELTTSSLWHLQALPGHASGLEKVPVEVRVECSCVQQFFYTSKVHECIRKHRDTTLHLVYNIYT